MPTTTRSTAVERTWWALPQPVHLGGYFTYVVTNHQFGRTDVDLHASKSAQRGIVAAAGQITLRLMRFSSTLRQSANSVQPIFHNIGSANKPLAVRIMGDYGMAASRGAKRTFIREQNI
jgi:hypothetical protein